jgi:AAA+ superfamily predicted ATPase
MGNPGTGKTAVARMMGYIFKAAGLLPTNNVVEVDRSKLEGAYVGQTAKLVNEKCDKAIGGILFIDEAYALKQGQGDMFGQEAIDALLKRMEDDRGKFVVIISGYAKEINDFIQAIPGLKYRFTDFITFDDFNAAEMREIFIGMGKKKNIQFGPGFDEALQKKMVDIYDGRDRAFANARTVRFLFDTTYEKLTTRVMGMTGPSDDERRREMYIMRPEDILDGVSGKTGSAKETDNNNPAGHKSVEDTVAKIANTLKMQKLTGQITNQNWHFVFLGKPSAEKIKVAHILADLFKDAGILPTNNVIETDRSKIVGAYLGQTGMQVNKQCDSAMGGILFIDDAYALKQEPSDMFGQEAVDTLLLRMENDRGKFVVIASGPTKEMEAFLQSNSGFKSRFTDCLNFDE